MKNLIKEITRITFDHIGNSRCYSSFDLPIILIYDAPLSAHVKIAKEITKNFRRFNEDFSASFITISTKYEEQFRKYCRSFHPRREGIAFLSLRKSIINKASPLPEELASYPIMGGAVYLLPTGMSFSGNIYANELIKEIENCGRKIYTLHYEKDKDSQRNLCLEATEMMKSIHTNKLSKNDDFTISKREAHQLVDRIFAINDSRLSNENLGIVEILDIPTTLEKKEVARIISDHTKVHIIDAWLGLCCEMPFPVYCDSVSKALKLEKALKVKGVTCYSY